MTKATQLLDLPAEILLLIAESVPHETLLQMRLACKEIETAAFTPFTEEYISELDCFLLDPARLKRVQNILASPRMLRRVQCLELTLAVYESSHGQVNIAPGKDLYRSLALLGANSSYIQDHCQALLEGPIPWDLIRDILRSIASSPDATLGLHLLEEDSAYSPILTRHPTLARDLLEAAMSAGCSLEGLYLSDKLELISPALANNLSSDEGNVYVNQFASNLTWFSLEAIFDTERDLDRAVWRQNFALTKKILAERQKLEHLMLGIEGSRRLHSIDNFTQLAPNLLKSAHLGVLKIINFDNLRLHSQDLVDLISQCAVNLTDIELINVTLLDDGVPWHAVLRGLRACLKLSKLDLEDSEKHGSFERSSTMRTLAPDDCTDDRYSSSVSAHGSEAVRQLLDINIERGLQYG